MESFLFCELSVRVSKGLERVAALLWHVFQSHRLGWATKGRRKPQLQLELGCVFLADEGKRASGVQMAASTLKMGRMEGFEGLMGKHGVKWLVQNRRSALKLEAQLQSPYDDLVTDREGGWMVTQTKIIQSTVCSRILATKPTGPRFLRELRSLVRACFDSSPFLSWYRDIVLFWPSYADFPTMEMKVVV